ncbi:hypothetical protein TARUN_8910 [Trichoderma arundinaceum]|uniref:Uncharacterized protein n=1 Tax=Trichoderma arundinaceum TaxID=490622 RepID=A0A395NBH0_TRIAR|nr:hypothetical protein TARUN_8910 [Trichoderma arundinaceum]
MPLLSSAPYKHGATAAALLCHQLADGVCISGPGVRECKHMLVRIACGAAVVHARSVVDFCLAAVQDELSTKHGLRQTHTLTLAERKRDAYTLGRQRKGGAARVETRTGQRGGASLAGGEDEDGEQKKRRCEMRWNGEERRREALEPALP